MLFIWAVLSSDLFMLLQQELLGPWAEQAYELGYEEGGIQQAVVAETGEEIFLPVFCTKTHANPGYVLVSQTGLAASPKGGLGLDTGSTHVSPEVTLMEVPWKKWVFRVKNESGKSQRSWAQKVFWPKWKGVSEKTEENHEPS